MHGVVRQVGVWGVCPVRDGRMVCERTLSAPFEVMRVPPLDEDSAGLVSRQHGATAREAALKVKPRTGTQRERVLSYIEHHRSWGATRDEIAMALGLSPNTVRPRVRELIIGGYVGISATRRPTPLDRAAEVIVAARYLEDQKVAL